MPPYALLNPNARYPMGIGYARGRQGLGFNRSTWNRGKAIGNMFKKGYDFVRARSAREQRKADRRGPPRKSVSTQTSKGLQIPIAGGDSKSSFFSKRAPSSLVAKLGKELVPSISTSCTAARVECGVGVNESALLGTYFNTTDSILAYTALNSQASAKIVFKSCHAESMITNQTNLNARIYLFDVVARRNSNDVNTDANIVYQLGFADGTGGAAADYLIVGTSPYGNPRFVEFFKIKKYTDITLSPGATHTHVVHIAPNKVMSQIDFSNSDGTFVGDWTHYTLMVFHGTPLNDVTTQTQVSTGAISLDVVQKKEYKYSYVHNNAAAVDTTNGLPGAFTVNGSTMQDDGVELAFNEA